ncbi:hypothetical protein [Sulfuriferula nivalis]|uniref:Uncharacterized protein n=1 Tax=Sulfuriferula nivalis TaxID=2675298 RepID=A0A809RGV9_9PROT|nr:hypothetical protein [Sulfuriferula nivalis]BBP00876.1 hypothetical protein SFSGTM_15840 [Sulfuriferula nivalis]
MSFNPSAIGTGVNAANAKSLMETHMAKAQHCCKSGSGSFAQALSNFSSPEAVQNRDEAKSSMKSIAQSQQSGADIQQAAQSLSGNTYASVNDYLQALSQSASQSISSI